MSAKAEPSFLRLPSLGLPSGVIAGGQRLASKKTLSRNALIAIAVVAMHVAFVWALQSGLLMRAAEQIGRAHV